MASVIFFFLVEQECYLVLLIYTKGGGSTIDIFLQGFTNHHYTGPLYAVALWTQILYFRIRCIIQTDHAYAYIFL